MARPFDIIVFGSSGFTGVYVVEEIIKFIHKNPTTSFKWAVSGRSKSKIQQALKKSSSWASVPAFDVNKVPVFESNINDYSSLVKLTKNTKILLSCVGPYRQFGRPVVEACIGEYINTDFLLIQSLNTSHYVFKIKSYLNCA